ncbi:MAG TPA: phosphoribosylformylglycinamidine synthase subunit PurS [Thermoplasmata archaeon]|nr:phosphoribosylformylglycinamidine synthase subunit PurS [Thermoplasmata archaeon]
MSRTPSKGEDSAVDAPGARVEVEVRVELKPGILDAEAESVQKALGHLGVDHVHGVRTARVYHLTFEGVSSSEARALAERAVDRLLANPVVHRVTIGPAPP